MVTSVKPLSLCQHLIRLYEVNPPSQKEESLIALPHFIRDKIFDDMINWLSQEDRYVRGNLCHLKYLPVLQRAVYRVALEIFKSLDESELLFFKGRGIEKEALKSDVHPSDAAGKLEFLSLLDVEMECVKEIKPLLEEWVARGQAGEKRRVAESRVLSFLLNPECIVLDFSDLQLQQLPPIFDKEPFKEQIARLNLSKNCLRSWPAEIANLRNVQHLNLSNNQLVMLPEHLGDFPQLQHLDLSFNSLIEVPESLRAFRNVEELILSFNAFSYFPDPICSLSNLRALDLQSNRLTALSDQIGLLRNLKLLFLHGNPLTHIPEELRLVEKLNTLTCGRLCDSLRDEVTRLIPCEAVIFEAPVVDLIAMQALFMQWKSRCAPGEKCDVVESRVMECLRNGKKTLDLSHLNLNSLPSIFSQRFFIENLEELNVSHNQLSKLPYHMSWLSHLRILNLSYNQLTALPEDVDDFDALKCLDLTHNQLATLAPEFCCHENLEHLALADNPLTELPEEIYNLKKLSTLTLTFDAFTFFPEQLADIPHCRIWMDGDWCPMVPSLPFLRRQHASAALSKIDSSVSCWTPSSQLLRIKVDDPLPHVLGLSHRDMLHEVALALWQYQVSLLKTILARQNSSKMADLERIAIGELSHNLRTMDVVGMCLKFGEVDQRFNQQIGAAMAAWTEEYKPVEYLFHNLSRIDGSLQVVRKKILQWAKLYYFIPSGLSEFMNEDGSLTQNGICFLLHELKVIDPQ